MRHLRLTVLLIVGMARPVFAGPTPETIRVFERYVELTEAQIARRVSGGEPFLWIDTLPETDRARTRAALVAGSVVIERVETRDGGSSIKVPDGMVHHWVGGVLIPNARVGHAVAVFQDYRRYPDIYAPRVSKAGVLHQDGDRFKAFLQITTKKVITVVLNSEYNVEYEHLPGGRVRMASRSTRMVEVDGAGTPEEREKDAGDDRGFLWRLNNYCSFVPWGDDTYLECQAVSLSRSIPIVLSPIVRPFVTSVPRDSLAFTLEATRAWLAGR